MAVVLPTEMLRLEEYPAVEDLFPLPFGDESPELFDIIKGHVPRGSVEVPGHYGRPRTLEEGTRGWLKITLAGTDQPSYTPPAFDSRSVRKGLKNDSRPKLERVALEVARVVSIYPHENPVDGGQRAGKVRGMGVGFTGRLIFEEEGVDLHASGFHFPGGKQPGWVYIPATNILNQIAASRLAA